MNFAHLGLSRRTIVLGAAVFAGLISARIGADAALNKLNPDGTYASSETPTGSVGGQPNRVALLVANSRYPDANTPPAQPVNDGRALSTALRMTALTSSWSRTQAAVTSFALLRG
jgi:hypothetical protein